MKKPTTKRQETFIIELKNPESKTVMLCPPPVLHITLGIVSAIVQAVEVTDPDIANWWVTASACQPHRQYGFTGKTAVQDRPEHERRSRKASYGKMVK